MYSSLFSLLSRFSHNRYGRYNTQIDFSSIAEVCTQNTNIGLIYILILLPFNSLNSVGRASDTPYWCTHARNHAVTYLLFFIHLSLPRANSSRLKYTIIFSPWEHCSLTAGIWNYHITYYNDSCDHWGCTWRLSIDGTLVPLVVQCEP